jgi:hypothetical protein
MTTPCRVINSGGLFKVDGSWSSPHPCVACMWFLQGDAGLKHGMINMGKKTQGGREGMRLGQRTRAVEPKEQRTMRCMWWWWTQTQGQRWPWEEGRYSKIRGGRDSVGAACRA